jgi:hypothetical protein
MTWIDEAEWFIVDIPQLKYENMTSDTSSAIQNKDLHSLLKE